MRQKRMTDQSDRPLPPPKRQLKRYKRRRDVDLQIDEALTLNPADLRRRVNIVSENEEGFFKAETIVYLLRDAYAAGDDERVGWLWTSLVSRSKGLVQGTVGGLSRELQEDAVQEVWTRLLEKLLSGDDSGDYYEVSYWSGLKRRSIDVFSYFTARDQVGWATSLSATQLGNGGAGDDLDPVDLDPSWQPEFAVLNQDTIQRIMTLIPEQYREAFYLHVVEDWPLSSSDPHRPSLCRRFNRTPETIRTWLKLACAAANEGLGNRP